MKTWRVQCANEHPMSEPRDIWCHTSQQGCQISKTKRVDSNISENLQSLKSQRLTQKRGLNYTGCVRLMFVTQQSFMKPKKITFVHILLTRPVSYQIKMFKIVLTLFFSAEQWTRAQSGNLISVQTYSFTSRKMSYLDGDISQNLFAELKPNLRFHLTRSSLQFCTLAYNSSFIKSNLV